MSFVELGRIAHAVRKQRTARRRAELRAVARALRDGVGSVNLAAPREVYDELFSFIGTGTLFTERQYGFVRPISIDDFEEVEALILRGQREGYLLARSREEIARTAAVMLRLPRRRRASGRRLLAADRAVPSRTRRRDHRALHADALRRRRRRGRAGQTNSERGARAPAALRLRLHCRGTGGEVFRPPRISPRRSARHPAGQMARLRSGADVAA